MTTQNVSTSEISKNKSHSNSAVNLGLAETGDAFESQAALKPGTPELFSPPRLQTPSQADLILEAKTKELGQNLNKVLSEFGIQVDESALTAFSATILKGGKEGILNALGFIYGVGKLAMTPSQSEGVSELLSSLITNPEHAEEIAMQLITDPGFLPISDHELEVINKLESPEVTTFLRQILDQKLRGKLQQMETEPLTKEQIAATDKFLQMIPSVLGALGSQEKKISPFESFFG